jgi:hypothetical protein
MLVAVLMLLLHSEPPCLPKLTLLSLQDFNIVSRNQRMPLEVAISSLPILQYTSAL